MHTARRHSKVRGALLVISTTWGAGLVPFATGLSLAADLPVPRHAAFALDPGDSTLELILFAGPTQSPLAGSIRLFLGDPDVPVIALAGMTGVSVDEASLVALDFRPPYPGLTAPMRLVQSPAHRSIGSWNTQTGDISFDLTLASCTDSASSGLPVPMPVKCTGRLLDGLLLLDGTNGNIPDGTLHLHLRAYETPLPPTVADLWFSTTTPFNAARTSTATSTVPVSDGDLLSVRGFVARTNRQLTSKLGFMPIVPDLGLDAAMPGPYGQIWFSFRSTCGPVWSETLKQYLGHGDLLSDSGRLVCSNADLVRAFKPAATGDLGLDAIARGPNRELLFSTGEAFYSGSLGRTVGHGDLLSARGRLVRTNSELLGNFHIIDLTMRPTPADYGLDAVLVRSSTELWFSTRIGFLDSELGWVSDGDLLSTLGYVVAENRDLLAAFKPLEDLAGYGLDALAFPLPTRTADFDGDGDVDGADLATFGNALSGPSVMTMSPEIGDLDGDGDTDQSDFAILQRCLSGAGTPSLFDCEE